MKRFSIITIAWSVVLCMTVCSCGDKFGDDLRSLGKRVEILEDSLPQVETGLRALSLLAYQIESQGFITNIEQDALGNYYFTFNDESVIYLSHGQDGEDGEEADIHLSIKQSSSDGLYYWTYNGEWLYDDNGDKIRAQGIDGNNGTDGKDGKDGVDGVDGKNGKNGRNGTDGTDLTSMPKLPRINPITRTWEVYSNGVWVDTGVYADGEDGKDGKKDIVKNIEVDVATSTVTLYLWDGRQLTFSYSSLGK